MCFKLSTSEMYSIKNMNWWGKTFLIFAAFQMVSYIFTSQSGFSEATLLDTILYLVFSGGAMIGLFYAPLEDKLEQNEIDGMEYLNNIVIPSYILEVGSYIWMMKIETVEHIYSVFINQLNVSASVFHNIEGLLFSFNLLFMTVYFGNVFLRVVGIMREARWLLMITIFFLGGIYLMNKFDMSSFSTGLSFF